MFLGPLDSKSTLVVRDVLGPRAVGPVCVVNSTERPFQALLGI